MKISVIIPVFNSELYLDDLFLSLSQQTLQDFEIIAIDDASSDQSFTILQKWQRKFANKMKIVHNPVNLGVGASRNIGLKLAKGEYISFIDSDDFIHPNMFYDLYYGALEYHFPEVLSTGIVFTKNLDHPGDFHSYRRKGEVFSPIDNPSKILFFSPSCGNKLFRRDFICQEFLANVMWEDIPFSYAHLFLANQVLDFHNPDYYYRKHDHFSVSNQGLKENPHLLDIFLVLDYLEFFLKQKGKYEKFQKEIQTIQVVYALYRIREVLDWNIPLSIKKQMVSILYHMIKMKYTDIKNLDQDALNMKVDFYTIDQVSQVDDCIMSIEDCEKSLTRTLKLLIDKN